MLRVIYPIKVASYPKPAECMIEIAYVVSEKGWTTSVSMFMSRLTLSLSAVGWMEYGALLCGTRSGCDRVSRSPMSVPGVELNGRNTSTC